mmetsp:Transcript_3617/g.9224  ORF Transcript_3617/g.9224 Transcript_3617/m.9224 type:complete len:272 (+) Transcript_3617:87-902(+)
MFSKQYIAALLVTSAACVQSASAFVGVSQYTTRQSILARAMYVDSEVALVQRYFVDTPENSMPKSEVVLKRRSQTASSQAILEEVTREEEELATKLQNVFLASQEVVFEEETNPMAVDKKMAAAASKRKKPNAAHKSGIFSPVVLAATSVLGKDQLNKLRAKGIQLHSNVIKSFVGTSESPMGQAVLKELFAIADMDNSGYLDKEEIGLALYKLGFSWLKEKQVQKIFQRADANSDNEISLEEFMMEAPKTLKTNLIKLAKNNGSELGFLV